MEDTDVSSFGLVQLSMDGFVDPCSCPISDVGSGNYEPLEGQALPPPATNYGTIGR